MARASPDSWSAAAMRILAGLFYLEPLDGWSILFWVGGVVWLLGGWPMFRWSLPAVAFLWFMVPLPFGVERWLSLPLQRVATNLSCWVLQSLGQPAAGPGKHDFAGANTIWRWNKRVRDCGSSWGLWLWRLPT